MLFTQTNLKMVNHETNNKYLSRRSENESKKALLLTRPEEHKLDLFLWCTQHIPALSVPGSTLCLLLHIHKPQLVYLQTSHLLISLNWKYKPPVLQHVQLYAFQLAKTTWNCKHTKYDWIFYDTSLTHRCKFFYTLQTQCQTAWWVLVCLHVKRVLQTRSTSQLCIWPLAKQRYTFKVVY